MNLCSLPRPLTGIIPPLVTPLLDASTLDRVGLERLIDHVLDGGVHGVFALGTTGEGPSLDSTLQREVVKEVTRHVAGRVPVLVGITDTAFGNSLALARHAADCGADAVVVAPPPYFAPDQAELLGYLQRLAKASPLPLVLYNMPVHTKVSIAVETVRAAAEIPQIIGLKDSSGNMTYFHQVKSLLAHRTDFTMLVGPEELLAESVLHGGHGGVNGGANLVPELYVSLFNAARGGDLTLVQSLHSDVMRLSMELYTAGKTGASMLQGLKCALSLRGICHDALAEPFVAFGAAERAMIAGRMRSINLTLRAPA
jgi:4-hydroxy-tetrahydrodipicolinate synthase